MQPPAQRVPYWIWSAKAACRGHAPLFVTPDHEAVRTRLRREKLAKHVCAVCPVRRTCTLHALSTPEISGVRGGLTEQEREAVLAAGRAKRTEDRRARST
jgi:WhiB family redox-sensing transcriptional regulator